MMEATKKTKMDIRRIGKDEEVLNVLKNKPVVVVSNHPAESDVPVLLSSLSNRKDFYLVINSSFCNIGKNIDKHLLPVHIVQRLFDSNKLNLRLRLLRAIHKTDLLDKETAQQKNRESINNASEKINRGGLVTIFPAAGSKDNKWFSGVGHIISGINKNREAFIVMAHIKGTSDWDYLRIIPGIRKLLPKIEVHFAKPIKINEVKRLDPKETVARIEEKYKVWSSGLSTKNIPIWTRLPQTAMLYLRSLILWITFRG